MRTGIAYLVSGAPDWRTRRMTQVYDLSDPAHPVKIRSFGLPGQEPGHLRVPTELHGPISIGPEGDRVYFGYGTNKAGIMQIVDRDKLFNGPKKPTAEYSLSGNIRDGDVGIQRRSTTLPMKEMPIAEFAKDKDGKTRDIVMIVDEAILNECEGARQMVWFADVTIETRPMMISSLRAGSKRVLLRAGGRFGSHSSNESMAPVFYKKMAFIAFFNAVVRALTSAIPITPKKSATSSVDHGGHRQALRPVDGAERCKVAIQTNNVETDDTATSTSSIAPNRDAHSRIDRRRRARPRVFPMLGLP